MLTPAVGARQTHVPPGQPTYPEAQSLGPAHSAHVVPLKHFGVVLLLLQQLEPQAVVPPGQLQVPVPVQTRLPEQA